MRSDVFARAERGIVYPLYFGEICSTLRLLWTSSTTTCSWAILRHRFKDVSRSSEYALKRPRLNWGCKKDEKRYAAREESKDPTIHDSHPPPTSSTEVHKDSVRNQKSQSKRLNILKMRNTVPSKRPQITSKRHDRDLNWSPFVTNASGIS
ncbi:hypothetical protein CC77DRAFT_211556 [Alternaria alternata]|jgi:hypothetical protein|uniref:Uncharacterized protein n=1 Tax=Alternaria alternata TaxID=5599 RepID=A0A177DG84_ALTAL|nr:hypothetical protein CC77DRAFT_211556 [Alternaria alternata]OAG18092.1 hypothetical protein CC77DRAFT_211556 [Alternaria alternata]